MNNDTKLERAGKSLVDLANDKIKLQRAYDFLANPFKKFYTLTNRERQVADLVLEGLTTEEVATFLGISPAGAGSYFQKIYAKTGLRKKELAPWVIKEVRKILEVNDG